MFDLGLFLTGPMARGRASGETPTPTPTPTPVIVPLVAPYADDFETPGSLDSRANWDVAGQTGQWSAFNGYLRRTNLYNTGGHAFFGPTLGDFTLRLGYDRSGAGETESGWESSLQNFLLWYVDASNRIELTLDPGNGRLMLGAIVGGSTAVNTRWAGVTFNPTGDLLIQSKAGKLRARVDGKWLTEVAGVFAWPFDVVDLTGAVASANRAGKVGVYAATWRYAQARYIELRPIEVTIDTIDQFVGRDALSGAGALGGTATLTGSYVGSPASWVYRLLDPVTLAQVKDWAAMTAVTAGAGAFTAGAFLPTGGPYIVEAGYVGADGFFRGSTSVPVVSGIRIVTYGQSNSLSRGAAAPEGYVVNTSASSAVVPGAGGAPAGLWTNASTVLPGSGVFEPGRNYETAKVAGAALGKPVGIQSLGASGVGLDQLIPGGSAWSTFTAGVAAGKGVIEALIWDQGEGDADGAAAPTGYAAMFLEELLPALRTATGNPALPVLISPIGRYADASAPNGYGAADGDAKREVLRQQYLAIVAGDADVSFSDSKLGCIHADPYHYTAAGYVEIGRRPGWSVARVLGAAVHDGRGPIVTAAARSGAVITLTLDLNGATGLAGPTSVATGAVPTPALGGAVNGFQVSTDDFATTRAIASVAISGSTIVITLAANPGAACKVRSHYGWSYDDTSLIYGAYADTANIPVFPMMTPLVTS